MVAEKLSQDRSIDPPTGSSPQTPSSSAGNRRLHLPHNPAAPTGQARPSHPDQPISPDQLDQLVQIVSPKRWLSLIALGTLVTAGLTWSVFGRIPITVKGQGVIVYPSQVINLQAASAGRLEALAVNTGDRVKKGQVLATIDQSELEQELRLAREKLIQLRMQDQMAQEAQSQRGSLDQAAIAQQRQALQQSLATVQSLTPVLREKGLESIQQERLTLEQQLQTLRSQLPVYEQRWQGRQAALDAGALPEDLVLQAEREYLDMQVKVNQIETQLKQLDTREAEAQREFLTNQNRINELQAQLQALESRVATQTEQDLAAAANRNKEIQDTERLIAKLELELKQSSQVVSTQDGTVVELAAKPGERLEPGMELGKIAVETSDRLEGVIFLPVSDGKKVKEDMAVQLTPTIVKREEYGGIVGRVKQVSAFPVTQQGAASLVGNPDILPGVLSEGAHVAVFAELEPSADTISGFRWSSSKGPNQTMTAGMTTAVRITVEERSPISYVLPILKSWTGLE
ncbi:MAG: NHLP bacteriocin system secretion protein [Elainella sp. Prado103]|jgi:HlyD family secretion protein|nr:NHLP bacteriocin system secretion protein [Elainella sp. Prado103]